MKKIKKMFRYENVGILFVFPAFLYMLVFVGYPIIRNIILSFQDVGAGNLVRGTKNFIMFDNYLELFKDSVFIQYTEIYDPVSDFSVYDRVSPCTLL